MLEDAFAGLRSLKREADSNLIGCLPTGGADARSCTDCCFSTESGARACQWLKA